MKTFFVTLLMNAQGLESIVVQVVEAKHEKSACSKALKLACHKAGTIEDGVITDLVGDFLYSVHSCKLVEPEHVDILKYYGL